MFPEVYVGFKFVPLQDEFIYYRICQVISLGVSWNYLGPLLTYETSGDWKLSILSGGTVALQWAPVDQAELLFVDPQGHGIRPIC